MFSKFYARRAAEAQAPAVYVVRDNATGRELARGEKSKMENYVYAFGACHIARA